jgi:hypothetical protein
METQNQIKRTLAQSEAIEQIQRLLDNNDSLNRTQLADKICEEFGFLDPRGRKQRSGCLKAIRELEKHGWLALPPCSGGSGGKKKPRRLSEPVAEAQGVPDKADKISKLRLVVVESEEQMRIWNELMIRDHPRGAGPLVGRQLRYLVESEYGWLGGLSFSSAALYLEDRDRWIGWDEQKRRSNLHHVVNLSRFLIRGGITCKNLASRLLGMAMREFPREFENRYGYRPLVVESFVDRRHFTGTCYRAANWQKIGSTKGRGRQDRYRRKAEAIKDIYVYPLEKDFRFKMGLWEGSGLGALEIDFGLESDEWAEHEFGGAPLGDKRLSRRLVEAAADQGEKPGRAYSGVVKGDGAKVKGYYRLIDKPDDSAVTMSNILLPHREQTIRRMKDQKTVLCIQDGTDLNYTSLDKCSGLGQIGKNQTGAQSKGLHLHSTLAISTEGLPLGVLRAECSAAEPKGADDKRRAKAIPIEEKKTFCWIEGLRDCMELKGRMPHTALINVMDREADFYELFEEQRLHSARVDLLVRGKFDRKIIGDQRLFDTVRQSSIQRKIKIEVPRQSARAKKTKQKARPKRAARTAEVSVRYTAVELEPPSYYKEKDPVSIWVVHAREDKPPKEAVPLEWFLLTTMTMKSADDAVKCIKWYCLRWRIEDWHRVLKSGCRVEDLAYETAQRLMRGIALKLVIAWRIMLMTLLGRESPELPAEVLFSDLEIKVLNAYSKKKGLNHLTCLGDAVKLVGKLGGHLGRAGDSPPGHQVMWHGYEALQLMCEGFALTDG